MYASRIPSRAALCSLAAGAVFAFAAPLFPFERVARAGDGTETTITIATSKDGKATVPKLEPMKPGETTTLSSESGKPVTVARTGDGYTIRTGEREFHVKARHDGDEGVNMVFVGDEADGGKVVVKKHAYAYVVGDGAGKPDAAEVLKKAAPKSLESLDRPTRDAVERVLQKMLEKGDVLAPGALPMVWHAKEDGDGDGERIKVMVIQKKDDETAKK